MVPEGHQGQGWERLASELKMACSALGEGRLFKVRKPEHLPKKIVVGKRSFAEVAGAAKPLEEDHSLAHKRVSVRIPISEKEVSAAGVRHPPVKTYGDSEQILSKTHSQTGSAGDLNKYGGWVRPEGGCLGEKETLKVVQWPEKNTVGWG
jgi:hypothetical protein